MRIKPLVISLIGGLLSFLIVFIVVPRFALGVPDALWLTVGALMAVAVPAFLLWKILRIPPAYIWFGLPMQYVVLFIFRHSISKTLGITLDGLGGFAYLFDAAVYPLVVTAMQFLTVLFFKKRKSDSKTDA